MFCFFLLFSQSLFPTVSLPGVCIVGVLVSFPLGGALVCPCFLVLDWYFFYKLNNKAFKLHLSAEYSVWVLLTFIVHVEH